MIQQLATSVATLVVVIVGLCIVLRVIRARTAALLIVGSVLLPVLAPAGWEILRELPTWAYLLLAGLLGVAVLRLVMRLLLGRRVADKVTAELILDLARWAARALLLPLRVAGQALRFLLRR
jgi:multisubunit Na+/H+ antiporter MnhF subunit